MCSPLVLLSLYMLFSLIEWKDVVADPALLKVVVVVRAVVLWSFEELEEEV